MLKHEPIRFSVLQSIESGYGHRYLMHYSHYRDYKVIRQWCRDTLMKNNFRIKQLALCDGSFGHFAFLDLKEKSDAAVFVLYWSDHIQADQSAPDV